MTKNTKAYANMRKNKRTAIGCNPNLNLAS